MVDRRKRHPAAGADWWRTSVEALGSIQNAKKYSHILVAVDALKKALAEVPACRILFMHQTFTEAVAGSSDHKIDTQVSLADVPTGKVGHLISGDIHKRQFIHSHQMHYVGSPLQLNYGERGEEKAFTLVDTEAWTFEAIPTFAPRFFWFKDTDKSPADISFEGISTDVDFIRVSYMPRFDAEARQLKVQYPRIQLDLQGAHPQQTQRISADELMQGGDRALLQEYVSQADTKDLGLDVEKCLEVGLRELAQVES